MGIKQDFTPVVNGRLTQVGVAFRSTRQSVYSAVFQCDCGKRKVMIVGRVKRGNAKSCGFCNATNTKPKKRSRLKTAWLNMLARCDKSCHPDHKNYGERGIAIDPAWRSYDQFAKDMGDPPARMTLERINNNDGYSKANCTWASQTQQARNRRSNSYVMVNGKNVTLAEASDILGVDRRRVRKYLRGS